jgi:hypothetical protein
VASDTNALPEVEADAIVGLLALSLTRAGITGPSGNPGPTGIQGIQGVAGPTGPVGPTGPIGVPGVPAICAEIRFPFTTSNFSSTAIIPAGASIWYASLNISQAYDNGAILLVGNASIPSELMNASDSDSDIPAKYEVSIDADWLTDAPVLISVLGGPTMGAAICVIRYAVAVP